MPIAYRLTDDPDLIADMRMDYVRQERPDMDARQFGIVRGAALDFIKAAQAEGRYLGFVGESEGKAVCAAGLLVYALPPFDDAEPRRVGHVLNFFTFAEHRRKGYGRGLMEFIILAARERGFDRLFLNATPDGYPLYAKCGFIQPEDKAMTLFLRE